MCGILGLAGSSPIKGLYESIDIGVDLLRHRGPDQSGVWLSEDEKVGFGHTRLSILDLSSAGSQPMRDSFNGNVIIFNGEIYNFKEVKRELERMGQAFLSQSDTEVVLVAYRCWGIGALSRLKGMFALSIYDAKEKAIYIARDRVGEKPLFYCANENSIMFSSELKALMAISKTKLKIDRSSLECFLKMGFVHGDRCILKDFLKLPPAHVLRFELSDASTKVWRYWELPISSGLDLTDDIEEDLSSELETLLELSVKRQLVADVPIGILLSGGTDSSLITAMAARNSNKVKTFTVKFTENEDYDESPHAEGIAKYFGTDHQVLECDGFDFGLLSELVRQFDEPIIDSSMLPTALLCRLVGEHCKVALGGDGGDELFGGYNHYARLLSFASFRRYIPRSLEKLTSSLADRYLAVGSRGKNWLLALNAQGDIGVPLVAKYFSSYERKQLMKKHSDWRITGETIYDNIVPKGSNLLDRAMRSDFYNYLAEDILTKSDRSSMMSSLELRAPMLDIDIVEFAFGKVSTQMKVNRGEKKILLRKLATKLLPPQFESSRKQGFSIPLDAWFNDGYGKELICEHLLSEDSIFNQDFIKKIVGQNYKGKNLSERLFGLLFFELWRKEYNVSF